MSDLYRPVPADQSTELQEARKRIQQLERAQPLNKVARIIALQSGVVLAAAVASFVLAAVVSVLDVGLSATGVFCFFVAGGISIVCGTFWLWTEYLRFD